MSTQGTNKNVHVVTDEEISRIFDTIEQVLRIRPDFLYGADHSQISQRRLNESIANLRKSVYAWQFITCRSWLRSGCRQEHLEKDSMHLMTLIDEFGQKFGMERVNSEVFLLIAAYLDGYRLHLLPDRPRHWRISPL